MPNDEVNAWAIRSTYLSATGHIVHIVLGTEDDAYRKAKEMFDPGDRGIGYRVAECVPFTDCRR